MLGCIDLFYNYSIVFFVHIFLAVHFEYCNIGSLLLCMKEVAENSEFKYLNNLECRYI